MIEFLQGLLDGSTQGSFIFLGIGVIALVILLVGVIFDGLLEALGLDLDGPFSVATLGAFFSAFGFVGAITIANGGNVGTASAFGAITGLVGGVGAFYLTRLLKNGESTTSVSENSLEGQEATVVLPILDGKLGEIAFSKNGFRQSFAARADENIQTGAKVKITAVLSGTSVKVEEIKTTTETEMDTK